MKVLQINTVCGTRSTGRIATDLYKILKERGHDAKIAYARYEPQNIEKNDAIKIGNSFDVYAHALFSRITDKTGFYSKKATVDFVKWIKEYDPDVVHIHNLHGYYINIEILFDYLAKSNKKIIWTMHDCWAITGHCPYFDMANCSKWKTGCYECPQKRKYPISYLGDNSKSNWIRKKQLFTSVEDLTIITPSNWLAGIIKQSYLGSYPVKTINNGIDLNKFKPVESNFKKKNNMEKNKIILGVASVWDERKGLADFIKLSQMLSDEYRIVLVGVSEKQMGTLPNNIFPIQRTNSITELAEIYTAADVFVNPTKEEVFGLVNIEALSCGTPVITYNTGGSPECIDETCGVVVPQNDICALASEIEKFFKTIQFSAQDCISYVKKFDKNDQYLEYIRLYEG